MTARAEASAAPGTSGHAVPLGAVLAHHAARTPARVCLTVGAEALTHEALDAAANRRARLLATHGVRRGDLVSVALPNSIEFYETTFAIWKLGAVPNIVPAGMPDAELRPIVDLVRPRVVVGVDPDRLPGRPVLPAATQLSPDIDAGALEPAVSPHWKAMTSGGSTGRPKVIVDAMPGLWDPGSLVLGRRREDVQLNTGPLHHSAPFSTAHQGLFSGLHLVDMQRFDAERALALIEAHRVNWMQLVPTMMHRIARLPREVRDGYDVASLRVVVHMGAPCPAWLKRAWIDWLGPECILEVYGGTERVGNTLITGIEWLSHPGSVGRPQAGARVRVLREDGADCRPGEVGEIFFLPAGGRGSGYSYLGATARAVGEWETLGDLGHLDDDGYLYVADRRTDLIVTGGANVYPAEVEAALEADPAVACAVVVGLPDADLGQRVHAIVQTVDGAPLDAAALDRRLRGLIAAYKLPRSIEHSDRELRDESGKVRRGKLRDARIAECAASGLDGRGMG